MLSIENKKRKNRPRGSYRYQQVIEPVQGYVTISKYKFRKVNYRKYDLFLANELACVLFEVTPVGLRQRRSTRQ